MMWKLVIVIVVVIVGVIAACGRRDERAPAHDKSAPPRVHATRARLDPELLLERHRTILIAGMITEQGGTEIIAKLLFLKHQDASAPITLYIDSPGGYVAPSLAIRDTIDELELPVYTHCLAEAKGTALVLLAHGARGHRTAGANARLGMTRIWAERASGGSAAEVARIDAIVSGMLASDTGRAPDVVARDVASERELDVGAARAYGLIDGVED